MSKCRTDFISVDVRDFSDEIARKLVWPTLVGDVTFEVTWQYSEGFLQTYFEPGDIADIDIEICELIAIGNSSGKQIQRNDVSELSEQYISREDIKPSLWKILEQEDSDAEWYF